MMLYEKIATGLRKILVDVEHEVLELPADSEPLFMLLTLGKDKAAFARLNGTPQKSADDAVEQLRRLYASNATKWTEYEFSLVLCQTGKIADEIITKVETDPYFCRKFILNVDKLDDELKNLPFIPLSILKEITERPVSAHTFLIQRGMQSELARHLVIPHIRGVDRIIDDCFQGEWGRLEWREFTGEAFVKAEVAKETTQIRLKKLEIEGFRVYREKQDFALDADVIVLFGPNGFGKTSFFDAVDFVCTGGVARLDERFGRNKRRTIQALKHLDLSVEDCHVAAVLSIDGEDVHINRNLADRVKATLNGRTIQRKPTLLKITGLSEETEDMGVDDLVHLFRATHLFGQEFQYLTCEFRKGSTLQKDIISRMLALQDYVQAIDKTEQIVADLAKRYQEESYLITNMEKDLSSKRNQLGELQKMGTTMEQPKAVDQMARDMAQRVSQQGIDVQDATFNEETARWWKSLINARMATFEQKASATGELVTKYPEYEARKKGLIETSKRLKVAKEAEEHASKQIKKLQSKLLDADTHREKIIAAEKLISAEKENLAWIDITMPKYVSLNDEIKKQNLVCESISEKMIALSSDITLHESQSEMLKAAINDKQKQVNDLLKKRAYAEELRDVIGEWQKSVIQEKSTTDDLRSLEIEMGILEHTLELKQQELLEAEQSDNETTLKLATLQHSHSDLQKLLSRMEDYVVGNTCPICGANYASRDELINKLRERIGEEPPELNSVRDLHNTTKSKLMQTKITISGMENKLEVTRQRRQKTLVALENLKNAKLEYQQKLSGLGIMEIKENGEEIINTIQKTVSETIIGRQSEIENAMNGAIKLEKELAEQKAEHYVLLETLRAASEARKSLENDLTAIEQSALDRKMSMNMTHDDIRNKLTEDAKLLNDHRIKLNDYLIQIQQITDELQTSELRKDALAKQIEELTITFENHNRYIEDIKKRAIEFDIDIDAGTDRIQQMLTKLDSNLITLNRLYQDLSNLEMALNIAEMSISMARINKEKADVEQSTAIEKRKLETVAHWNNYFSRAKEDLEQLNSRALEQYTDAYGPLSTSIQRRLRYVYGFGDINLHVKEGDIIVDVAREGYKELSPSDFFSESQIQIAMFSLFLSANLTQNWSRFHPVLLDDPVEHFDDLNSYALVGLIKRLASRGRQFIISTCDERLYRLMRQQFKTTDNKVVFYKFVALGEGGPVIETS